MCMVRILKLNRICSLPLHHARPQRWPGQAAEGFHGLHSLAFLCASHLHSWPPCSPTFSVGGTLARGLHFLEPPIPTLSPCAVCLQAPLACPPPSLPLPLPASSPSAFSATAALFPLPHLSPRYVEAWRGKLLPPQAPLLLLPASFGLWQKPHLLTCSSQGTGK